MAPFGDRCFNPFHIARHRKAGGIRKIAKNLSLKWNLLKDVYVCTSCRNRLQAERSQTGFNDLINNGYVNRGVTSNYQPEEIESKVIIEEEITNNTIKSVDSEILDQLKTKFNDPSTLKSNKNMILTCAPKSWSEYKLATEFGTSRRQARNAKKIVEKHGILSSSSNSFNERQLPVETENLVRSFYLREDNSRIMPGKQDFVSVKENDGKRCHYQKQLLLCNIKELFEKFKQEFPDVKVGLAKFFLFRPKQCILAGDSGSHLVCDCTYHQNVNLMLAGGNVASFTAKTDMQLSSYKECLKRIMCANPTPVCQLMTSKSPSNERCFSCPGTTAIEDHLRKVFDENDITSIHFEAWVGKGNFSIATQVIEVDDFIECLCAELNILRPHAYIAEQQALYFKDLKETINENEIIVQCDFAENYSFVVQDAAQAFHWNNDQATLLTSVFYYKEGQDLKHQSIVMISDHLKHDTVSFYSFQKILHQHLKEKGLQVLKIIYVTDGAPQQFKNQFNMANLYNYKHDFGIDAEFHFHATAHGKGPRDGLGGNLKRLATRASLQLPTEKAITTSKRLKPNLKLIFISTVKNKLTNKEMF